jgi:hypothetical protein
MQRLFGSVQLNQLPIGNSFLLSPQWPKAGLLFLHLSGTTISSRPLTLTIPRLFSKRSFLSSRSRVALAEQRTAFLDFRARCLCLPTHSWTVSAGQWQSDASQIRFWKVSPCPLCPPDPRSHSVLAQWFRGRTPCSTTFQPHACPNPVYSTYGLGPHGLFCAQCSRCRIISP